MSHSLLYSALQSYSIRESASHKQVTEYSNGSSRILRKRSFTHSITLADKGSLTRTSGVKVNNREAESKSVLPNQSTVKTSSSGEDTNITQVN